MWLWKNSRKTRTYKIRAPAPLLPPSHHLHLPAMRRPNRPPKAPLSISFSRKISSSNACSSCRKIPLPCFFSSAVASSRRSSCRKERDGWGPSDPGRPSRRIDASSRRHVSGHRFTPFTPPNLQPTLALSTQFQLHRNFFRSPSSSSPTYCKISPFNGP